MQQKHIDHVWKVLSPLHSAGATLKLMKYKYINNSSNGKKNKVIDSFSRNQVFHKCDSFENQEMLSKAIENTTSLETNTILYVTWNKRDSDELELFIKKKQLFNLMKTKPEKLYEARWSILL